jgi:hypothetical protein
LGNPPRKQYHVWYAAGRGKAAKASPSVESWEEYRKGILDETSRFIEWGLKHPDLVVEIPAKPAGQGGFPPKVSEWFWGIVLSDRKDSWVQRWKDFLLRRPRRKK